MKLKDFLAKYEFKFSTVQSGRELIATTEVSVRRNGKCIGRIASSFDIIETNSQLAATYTPTFLFQWDWDKLIKETKRMQLDHFSIQIPLDDFFPRSEQESLENIYNSSERYDFKKTDFRLSNLIRITSVSADIDFCTQGVYIELYKENEDSPFKEFDSRLELCRTNQAHTTVIEIPVQPGNITVVVSQLDMMDMTKIQFSAH